MGGGESFFKDCAPTKECPNEAARACVRTRAQTHVGHEALRVRVCAATGGRAGYADGRSGGLRRRVSGRVTRTGGRAGYADGRARASLLQVSVGPNVV